jgi:hypothetical protein
MIVRKNARETVQITLLVTHNQAHGVGGVPAQETIAQ